MCRQRRDMGIKRRTTVQCIAYNPILMKVEIKILVVIGFGGVLLAFCGSEASLRAFAPRLTSSRERERGREGTWGKYRNKVLVEDFEGLVHLQRKCTRKGRMETKGCNVALFDGAD